MSEIKIPFACDSSGRIYHARDKVFFAAMRLKCLTCEQKVMHVAGKQRQWHFRHYPDKQCAFRPGASGGESALHMCCKEWVARNLEKITFELTCYRCGHNTSTAMKVDTRNKIIRTEHPYADSVGIADVGIITVPCQDAHAGVEVYVSHAVPPEKWLRATKNGVVLYEVNALEFVRVLDNKDAVCVSAKSNCVACVVCMDRIVHDVCAHWHGLAKKKRAMLRRYISRWFTATYHSAVAHGRPITAILRKTCPHCQSKARPHKLQIVFSPFGVVSTVRGAPVYGSVVLADMTRFYDQKVRCHKCLVHDVCAHWHGLAKKKRAMLRRYISRWFTATYHSAVAHGRPITVESRTICPHCADEMYSRKLQVIFSPFGVASTVKGAPVHGNIVLAKMSRFYDYLACCRDCRRPCIVCAKWMDLDKLTAYNREDMGAIVLKEEVNPVEGFGHKYTYPTFYVCSGCIVECPVCGENQLTRKQLARYRRCLYCNLRRKRWREIDQSTTPETRMLALIVATRRAKLALRRNNLPMEIWHYIYTHYVASS